LQPSLFQQPLLLLLLLLLVLVAPFLVLCLSC
jgi:hypothetical protein